MSLGVRSWLQLLGCRFSFGVSVRVDALALVGLKHILNLCLGIGPLVLSPLSEVCLGHCYLMDGLLIRNLVVLWQEKHLHRLFLAVSYMADSMRGG